MEKTQTTSIALITTGLPIQLHHYIFWERTAGLKAILHHEFFESVLLTAGKRLPTSNHYSKRRSEQK
jgi:hypothetical protein